MVWSEQGVADTQWPVAGGAERGQFGVDVDFDGADEVDVLAVRWGDVGQQLVVDAVALALIQGPSWGWSDARVLGMFALAVAGGGLFATRKSASSRPLVPAAFSLFFFLSYYLQ